MHAQVNLHWMPLSAGLAGVAGVLGARRPQGFPTVAKGQSPCLAASENSNAAAACACSTSSRKQRAKS